MTTELRIPSEGALASFWSNNFNTNPVTARAVVVVAMQGHFRDELIEKVIFMCSRDKFAYLADFAWYISVLVK